MASSLTGAAKALYKACIDAPQNTLSQGDLLQKVKIANKKEVTDAINVLLKKKLFTLMKAGKEMIYKAVTKQDAQIKGDMEGDEGLVYSHIEGAANEGIWTKTLKTRTNLHQTVLNRCLKTLEQKQLVKVIKSVKFPTRKIYMLFGLQPSTDVSGGPWYTDHELDIEFINQVSGAILMYIKDRSFPRPTPSCPKPLYSATNTSKYPTVEQITAWVRKSKISAIDLGSDHVQTLLDVLVYDGEIESLPAIGRESDDEEESEDEERRRKKKRRRSESDDDDDGRVKKRKKGKRRDDPEDKGTPTPSSKKRKHQSDDEEYLSGSENETGLSKRHRKERQGSAPTDDDDDDMHSSGTKSNKRKRRGSSVHSSATDSPVATNSKTEKQQSAIPDVSVDIGGGLVYRAVRPERIGLGWSQAPCGRCPVFDFCVDGGPVNSKGCKYFDGWFELAMGE